MVPVSSIITVDPPQADIKPQTDGCNGLKYNLTGDVIECIFKTYPAVKRKHQENVPQKISESDFWTKFFQSHYFHRDRINAGTKDLFTECAKIDDQELKKDLQSGINDPLLDITSFDDQSLDENYGGGCGKSDTTSGNIVHQSMIKRFNQHSIMVLKASTAKQQSSAPIASQPQLNGSAPSASKDPYDRPDDRSKTKRVRYIVRTKSAVVKTFLKVTAFLLVNISKILHSTFLADFHIILVSIIN